MPVLAITLPHLPAHHPDAALTQIAEAIAAAWRHVEAVNAIPLSHGDDVWMEHALAAWEHAKSRLEEITPTTREGRALAVAVHAMCEDAEWTLAAQGAPRFDPPPLSGLMKRSRAALRASAAQAR